MSTGRINKTSVENLPEGGILWDSDPKGFGVRRQRKAPTYVLKVRIGGVQRFFTIGPHGSPWTPETARREARRLLGDLAAGGNPYAAREASKLVPTFAQFADRYMAEYAELHKRPRTIAEDKRNLELHILPAFGRELMTEITPAMISRFHAGNSNRPINSNRCIALLSHMFSLAEKWGILAQRSNPCFGIRKYAELKRERYLSEVELARLGNALDQARKGYPTELDGKPFPFRRKAPEDFRAIALFRFLLFTGARLSEALTLERGWIDTSRGIARLPKSKTGAKNLMLPPAALRIVDELPEMAGNPFVFFGDRPGQHFNGVQKAWQRIRTLAQLPDVRIHDLRHAFASVAVNGGESLFIVGNALGHQQPQTTQRYAHLRDDATFAAAERTSSKIEEALKRSL